MTYDPVTCDKCANKTPEYGDDGQPIASGHRCAAHCTEISRYPRIMRGSTPERRRK